MDIEHADDPPVTTSHGDDAPGSDPDAAAEPPVAPEPRSDIVVAPARPTRPTVGWIAVAALLVLAAGSLVAWRAAARHDPATVDGTLIGGTSSVLGFDENRPREARWLNLAGPDSTTDDGDRFTAGCRGPAPTESDAPCAANPDRDPRGHLFVVRVDRTEALHPLFIEAADPQLHSRNATTACTKPTPPGATASGCPADITPSTVGFTTTFIVREPDATPNDPLDNPAICASSFTDTATGLDGALTESLWVPICAIPTGSVRNGDYIVQVRSDADRSAPHLGRRADLDPGTGAGSLVRADPTATGDGENHFALRARWDGDPDDGGRGITVDALDHLVLFVNQVSASSSVPLVELSSDAAGKVLRVTAFDLGDLSATGQRSAVDGIDLRIAAPAEATIDGKRVRDLLGCTFTPVPGTGTKVRSDRCAIENAERAAFNGTPVVIDVPIPADYRCDASPDECWAHAQLDYGGAPNDSASWTVQVLDPPATAGSG